MYKVIIYYELGGSEVFTVASEHEARDAVESWQRRESFIVVGNQLIDRDIVSDVTAHN